MQSLHEQGKRQLQDSSTKYKQYVYLKKKEVQFEVGYLALAHLRKEIFPKGGYNKLKVKKIGPCRILRKFSTNAHELEFPLDIGISPIFNVANLYLYKGDIAEALEDVKEQTKTWKKKLNISWIRHSD